MRVLRWLLALLVVGIVLLAGGVAGNDLPLRDSPGLLARLDTYLNTHVAETVEGSPFPELRPRHYPTSPDVLYGKITEAMSRLPRWEVVASSKDVREVHAVVTTPLLRFKDDVVVRVIPEPGRPALVIRAQSRIGRGDLGANTRHVLDLYKALESVGARGRAERPPDPPR
jgi:uncharacterized protein (DUF1499 family)